MEDSKLGNIRQSLSRLELYQERYNDGSPYSRDTLQMSFHAIRSNISVLESLNYFEHRKAEYLELLHRLEVLKSAVI